jgi:hypothetical protein
MERGVRSGQESLVNLAEPFSQTSDGMNEEVDDSADDPEQTEHIDTF